MAGSRKEKFACDKGIFIPCMIRLMKFLRYSYDVLTMFLRIPYEFLTKGLLKVVEKLNIFQLYLKVCMMSAVCPLHVR